MIPQHCRILKVLDHFPGAGAALLVSFIIKYEKSDPWYIKLRARNASSLFIYTITVSLSCVIIYPVQKRSRDGKACVYVSKLSLVGPSGTFRASCQSSCVTSESGESHRSLSSVSRCLQARSICREITGEETSRVRTSDPSLARKRSPISTRVSHVTTFIVRVHRRCQSSRRLKRPGSRKRFIQPIDGGLKAHGTAFSVKPLPVSGHFTATKCTRDRI